MKGRRCTKCGKHKNESHFEKNGRLADGSARLRSICKQCGSRRKLVLEGPKKCSVCRKTKPPSEFRTSHSPCRDCHNERTYRHRRTAGRAAHNARMVSYETRKWKEDPLFRQKVYARQAVYIAVKAGAIARPTKCPKCGRKTRLHAHHYLGYDKKNWLKVRWRCARCHYQEDKSRHRKEKSSER